MYRVDRYCIEVISIFDLYFDIEKDVFWVGFDPATCNCYVV